MQLAGKVLLCEILGFENLTDTLCNTERKLKLSLLLFGYSSKTLPKQTILCHRLMSYNSKVAL